MIGRAGYLAALIGGTVLWSVAMALSGGREPWDTREYWMIYLPAAYVLCGLLGFAFPERTWRWALVVLVLQIPVVAAVRGIGNLWVLGIVTALILALPAIPIAALGGWLRRRQSMK